MVIRRERKRLRHPTYDYSAPGAYFITTVKKDRAMLFGRVVDGAVHLNEAGQVVADTWQWLADQYPYVVVDVWVVMPNHTHAIIVIAPVGAGRVDVGAGRVRAGRDRPPPQQNKPKIKPLGQLVGAFKTVSAKQINILRQTPGAPVWQRGFHDRIIRDDREWTAIRAYIHDNPRRWRQDRDNLEVVGYGE